MNNNLLTDTVEMLGAEIILGPLALLTQFASSKSEMFRCNRKLRSVQLEFLEAKSKTTECCWVVDRGYSSCKLGPRVVNRHQTSDVIRVCKYTMDLNAMFL